MGQRGGRYEESSWDSGMHLLAFLPAVSIATERFDGTWHTHVDCPAKGNMEAFAWKFESVIQGGNLRGGRGTEGEPGSFVLTGKLSRTEAPS
jgi:hypothetical protein